MAQVKSTLIPNIYATQYGQRSNARLRPSAGEITGSVTVFHESLIRVIASSMWYQHEPLAELTKFSCDTLHLFGYTIRLGSHQQRNLFLTTTCGWRHNDNGVAPCWFRVFNKPNPFHFFSLCSLVMTGPQKNFSKKIGFLIFFGRAFFFSKNLLLALIASAILLSGITSKPNQRHGNRPRPYNVRLRKPKAAPATDSLRFPYRHPASQSRWSFAPPSADNVYR